MGSEYLAHMKFVLKNVLRRKFRTLFSVLGVGLGISIMVALFTISDDLIGQVRDMMETQRGDVIVGEAAAEELESSVDVDWVEPVAKLPNVKHATPMIAAFLRTEGDFNDNPAILYYGIKQDNPINAAMEMVEGERIADSEPNGVVFGEIAWKIVNEKMDKAKRLSKGSRLSLMDLITSEGFASVFGKAPEWEKMTELQRMAWVYDKLARLGIHRDAMSEESDEEYQKRTGKDPKVWLRRADETNDEYRKRSRDLDPAAFPHGVDPLGNIATRESKLNLYVRGVCRTGFALQDAAVYFHLDKAQVIKGMHKRTEKRRVKRDGRWTDEIEEKAAQCTMIVVTMRDSENVEQINEFCQAINRSETEFRDLRAQPSRDIVGRHKELQLIEKFGWVVSIIAALAGALGIMNVMMMAVLERTREIGLMLAVGWPKSRILLLTILEGLVIAVLGGIVGVAFGYGETILARDYIGMVALTGGFNWLRAGQALGLAFVIGFFASLYPAWRASRLTPIDALRQE